jgi:hypothetical protein
MEIINQRKDHFEFPAFLFWRGWRSGRGPTPDMKLDSTPLDDHDSTSVKGITVPNDGSGRIGTLFAQDRASLNTLAIRKLTVE